MKSTIPSSIAIAGLYGYISHLIYQAAVELGVKRNYGIDPGVKPNIFIGSDRLELLENQEDFYNLDVDLFHIATHPEVRQCVFNLIRKGKNINIQDLRNCHRRSALLVRFRSCTWRYGC